MVYPFYHSRQLSEFSTDFSFYLLCVSIEDIYKAKTKVETALNANRLTRARQRYRP